MSGDEQVYGQLVIELVSGRLIYTKPERATLERWKDAALALTGSGAQPSYTEYLDPEEHPGQLFIALAPHQVNTVTFLEMAE